MTTEVNKQTEIGIFETMKVTATGIEVPHLHWERMKKGGELLGIEIPDYTEWLNKVNRYFKEINEADRKIPFALRIEMRGRSAQCYFNSRTISYTSGQYEQGVKVIFLQEERSDGRPLTYIKSADLLDTVSALKRAEAKGAFEGIWLNCKGQIMEGTRSNIFFIKHGVIHTPSLENGCLAGTRRQIIREMAAELKLPFLEGNYLPQDLLQADEVFLSNALMGVMPVSQMEDRIFIRPTAESITALLTERIETFLHQKN